MAFAKKNTASKTVPSRNQIKELAMNLSYGLCGSIDCRAVRYSTDMKITTAAISATPEKRPQHE